MPLSREKKYQFFRKRIKICYVTLTHWFLAKILIFGVFEFLLSKKLHFNVMTKLHHFGNLLDGLETKHGYKSYKQQSHSFRNLESIHYSLYEISNVRKTAVEPMQGNGQTEMKENSLIQRKGN